MSAADNKNIQDKVGTSHHTLDRTLQPYHRRDEFVAATQHSSRKQTPHTGIALPGASNLVDVCAAKYLVVLLAQGLELLLEALGILFVGRV